MAATANRYEDLAQKVAAAIVVGQQAAAAQDNDGGSANLDHVVLTGLPGVRETSLRKAGIAAHKGRWGFHLSAPFDGQGQRRYAGVQAMCAHLQAAGVECHVFYQLD
jgi:hypothetical protein